MQSYYYKRVDDGSFSVVEYDGNDTDVIIPEMHAGQPVTVLYDRLFRGHAEIRSLAIPDTVTDIGAFVFDGCRELTKLRLPAGLKYMWPYAFCRSSLEEIILPERIRTIAPHTFQECKKLKRIVCNSGLKEIKALAFEGCSKDLEIIHDDHVKINPRALGKNLRD